MDGLPAAIELGVYLATAAVGIAFIWRHWKARRLARAARAIEAPVVSVRRAESGSRMYSWFVEEELRVREDWAWPAVMAFVVGLAAWAARTVAVEYWEP